MNDKELKRISDEIVKGKFKNLIDILEKNCSSISQKQSIILIICCCTTCNANVSTPANLNQQEIITSVKGLARNIVEVSIQEFDSYLQSIYFICMLLLKKSHALLLQLDTEIIPSFIPTTLTDKQKGIYRSICGLIQTEIGNTVNDKKQVDSEKLFLIGSLLSKIILASQNQAVVYELIVNYGGCLQNLNLSLNIQYEYFLLNYKVLKQITEKHHNNGILHFVQYGISIFTRYLKEGQFEESKKCLEKVLEVLPNIGELSHWKNVLKLCMYIVDPNIEANTLVKYKDLWDVSRKLYGNTENFRKVCKLTTVAVSSLIYFCENNRMENISAGFEQNSIFCQIFYELMAVFTVYSKPCTDKCVCSKQKYVPEGHKLVVSITILFTSIYTKCNIPKQFLLTILSYFEKYCDFLDSLRVNNCEEWQKYWSDISIYFHNLGVLILRKKDFQEAISLSNMILKYDFLLGKFDNKLIVQKTLSLLNFANSKQKNYTEALMWIAMEIIYAKGSSRNGMFSQWVKLKVAARDDKAPLIIQELTISSVILQIPSEHKCYLDHIDKSKEYEIDLLIDELEIYYQKWQSKIPMMSAFRHLCEIADNSTLMNVFVKVFSDWDMRVHDDTVQLLEKVFVKFEKSLQKSAKQKIFLGFIYYFRYKIQSDEMITKNIKEMNKTVQASKAPSYPVDILPADAYDQCDVVSVYERLKIDGGKMEHLIQSLSQLEDVLTEDFDESLFEEIEMVKVYNMMKTMALEFSLHFDMYHSSKALYLSFKIAQSLGNNNLIVESCGYLFRDIQDSKLEKKMQKLISQMKENDQNHQYLVQYYLNLSRQYLTVKNVPQALLHFNNAENFLKSCRERNENNIWYIDISVELLRFKLMQASLNSKRENGLAFQLKPLLKAQDLMVERYNAGQESRPFCLMLLLEILETLVKVYHDLKMPREVRCFGKDSLTLTQQYILPIYSVKILCYLAHADFRCERFDDCRVKLDGISEILQIDNRRRHCRPYVLEKKRLPVPVLAEITEGIQEIMLDNPNPAAFNVKSSPSSPVFIGEPYRPPSFLDHGSCNCCLCTCVEYHKLLISYFHLKALWYMHQKQITLANSFFRGTFDLYETLKVKRSEVSTVFSEYIPLFSIPSAEFANNTLIHYYSFEECKYSCSVDYVKFLYSSGALDAGKTFNDKLVSQLKLKKSFYPNLYGEALLQKLGLLYGKSVFERRTEVSAPISGDSVCKTPEKCIKSIMIPKVKSPQIKRFVRPKVIKFNLGDADADETKVSTSKETGEFQTPGKTPKRRMLPPSLRVTNTPLLKTPAKPIDSGDGKSGRTCKTSRTSQSLFNTTFLTETSSVRERPPLLNFQDNFTPNTGNLGPQNKSEQKTNNKVKIKENILDVNTKLLTSKLKNKNQMSVASGTCNETNSNYSSKKGVNKTKPLDFNMGQKENDIQPVRRSRRNRT